MITGRVNRLGWTQRNVLKHFDSTCTIRRNDTDLIGPLDDETFLCSVYSMISGSRIEGEVAGVNSWVVLLPIGTDVKMDDYIIERGRTIQVVEVPTPESHEPYVAVICQRI
jgi:hypothetical protein